jgi:hypothetical protein
MRSPWRASAAASACLVTLALPRAAAAQERFALQIDLGQSAALTSYNRNVVYVEESNQADTDPAVDGKPLYQPYLADESANQGALFGVSLIVDDLEFGVSTRWLDRDSVTLHHRGDQLLPRRRERPDGTFDDSGVTYSELAQDREVLVPTRGRGALFVGELYASYRLPIPYARVGQFSGYAPLGAGAALVNVQEPNRPLAVALQAHAGLGAMYEFSDSLALSAVGKLYGLASFEYTNSSDAARRAVEAGAGTADALFSTMVSASAQISLIFIVR